MFSSRVWLLPPSRPWGRWWAWPIRKLFATRDSQHNTPLDLKLPDGVVDAYITWQTCCSQRNDNAHPCDCWRWSPRAAAVLFSKIPPGSASRSTQDWTGRAPPSDVSSMGDVNGSCVLSSPPHTVGAIYDAFVEGMRFQPSRCPSLEEVTSFLATLVPWLLRFELQGADALGCEEDRGAQVILSYCEGVSRKDGSEASHPFLLRLLRQVCVTWQPWLSPAQRARLITDGERFLPTSRTAEVRNAHIMQEEQWRHPNSVRDALITDSEGERWRLLLEHVPPFFVPTLLVASSLRRTCSSESVTALLNAWVAHDRDMDAVDGDLECHRGSPAVRPSWDNDVLHRKPYVESSSCGTVVRAPSDERCLQAGCPSSLIYAPRRAFRPLKGQYSLLRRNDYGATSLFHDALALLCAVVPTAPCALDIVRQLFKANQQREDTRFVADNAILEVDQAAFCACRSRFPTVEALLDHPELSFAVIITDAVTGNVSAGLPLLSPREARKATHSIAQGHGPRLFADDKVHVQLHPSFSHGQRGRADLALSLLQLQPQQCFSEGTEGFIRGAPSYPCTVTRTAAHRYAVRVHDISTATPPAELQALAEQLHAFAASSPSTKSSLHSHTSLVAINQVFFHRREQCLDAPSSPAAPLHLTEASRSLSYLLVSLASVDRNIIDMMVVREPSTLLRALGGVRAPSVRPETAGAPSDDSDSENGCVRSLVTLLRSPHTVKLVPSDVFAAGISCGVAPRASCSCPIALLLHALPSGALPNVCSLAHISSYAGDPLSDVFAAPQSWTEAWVASLVNARHNVDVFVDEAFFEHFLGDLETCAHLPGGIRTAAAQALAASLLLRGRMEEEERMGEATTSLHQADLEASDTVSGWRALFWTLPCALRVWIRTPSLAWQHSLAIRLLRYQRWLQESWSDGAATNCVDNLSDRNCVACLKRALPIAVSVDGALRPAADMNIILKDLRTRFGPEPLPGACGINRAKRVRVTALSDFQKASKPDAAAAAPAELPNERAVDDAVASGATVAGSEPPVAEIVDIDAVLYDSLVKDAASSGVTISAKSSSRSSAAASAATHTGINTGTSCSGWKAALLTATCQSGGEMGGSSSLAAGSDDDALGLYLATLMDELEGDALLKPTPSSTAIPAPVAPQANAFLTNEDGPEEEMTARSAPRQTAAVRATPACSPSVSPAEDVTPLSSASYYTGSDTVNSRGKRAETTSEGEDLPPSVLFGPDVARSFNSVKPTDDIQPMRTSPPARPSQPCGPLFIRDAPSAEPTAYVVQTTPVGTFRHPSGFATHAFPPDDAERLERLAGPTTSWSGAARAENPDQRHHRRTRFPIPKPLAPPPKPPAPPQPSLSTGVPSTVASASSRTTVPSSPEVPLGTSAVDQERLRLASLLIDILRGTSAPRS